MYLISDAKVENFFLFSPRVMRAFGNVHLWDVKSTLHYWRWMVNRNDSDSFLSNLCQMMLSADARLVLADHPWKGLLLLQHMRRRKLTGALDHKSSFAEAQIDQIPIATWLGCARLLLPKSESDIAKMERALKRLRVKTLVEIKHVHALEISRRFGKELAQVWEWTWKDGGQDLPFFADSFPWKSHQPEVVLSQKRDLEFPLQIWEHLEPYLQEDMKRLCALPGFQREELVTEMIWRLRCDQGEPIELKICFRNPYHLQSDGPSYPSAILQCRYGFEKWSAAYKREHNLFRACLKRPRSRREMSEERSLSRINEHRSDSSNAEVGLFRQALIVGWDLTISERFCPSLRVSRDVFGKSGMNQNYDILELENKLPVPLQHFGIRRDFLPSEDFALKTPASVQEIMADISVWVQAAKDRPLFLFQHEEVIDGAQFHHQFLERNSLKWWRNQPGQGAQSYGRDYFQSCVEESDQMFWTYFDGNTKRWVKHGVYR